MDVECGIVGYTDDEESSAVELIQRHCTSVALYGRALCGFSSSGFKVEISYETSSAAALAYKRVSGFTANGRLQRWAVPVVRS